MINTIYRNQLEHYFDYGYILNKHNISKSLNSIPLNILENNVENIVSNKHVVLLLSGIDSYYIGYLCKKYAKSVTSIFLQLFYWENTNLSLIQNLSNKLNIPFINIRYTYHNICDYFIKWCLSYPFPYSGSDDFNKWEILTEVSKNYGELIVTGFGADQIFDHKPICRNINKFPLTKYRYNKLNIYKSLSLFNSDIKTSALLTSLNAVKLLFKKLESQFDISIYSPYIDLEVQLNMNKYEYYSQYNITKIPKTADCQNILYLLDLLAPLVKKYKVPLLGRHPLNLPALILKIWCTENNVEIVE